MNVCGCKAKCDCTLGAIIASVIIGIITAFLNFSATIAVPQFILFIFSGVALVLLALLLVTAPFVYRRETDECLCASLNTFLAGVLGTLLFSLVLILVDIATAGLLGSLLTGLLFASFALTVTSIACLLKSILNCGR